MRLASFFNGILMLLINHLLRNDVYNNFVNADERIFLKFSALNSYDQENGYSTSAKPLKSFCSYICSVIEAHKDDEIPNTSENYPPGIYSHDDGGKVSNFVKLSTNCQKQKFGFSTEKFVQLCKRSCKFGQNQSFPQNRLFKLRTKQRSRQSQSRFKREPNVKSQLSLTTDSVNLVPTYMLPTIYTIPVRAVLLNPSNLVPIVGNQIEYIENLFENHEFHIVQLQFGMIQLRSVSNQNPRHQWKQIEKFTGLQILQEKIRYVGTVAQPENSDLPFQDQIHLTCLQNRQQHKITRLILPVHFIRISIHVKMLKPLLIRLGQTRDETLNPSLATDDRLKLIESSNLEIQVEPYEKDSLIWLILLESPKHGHLFLVNQTEFGTDQNSKLNERIYLGVGSRFTQQDIKDYKLFYIFRRVLDENELKYHDLLTGQMRLADSFKFRTYVQGYQPRKSYEFKMFMTCCSTTIYDKLSNLSPSLINKGGVVNEGGELILTPDIFYAHHPNCATIEPYSNSTKSDSHFGLFFQLISLPEYGSLVYKYLENSTRLSLTRYVNYPSEWIRTSSISYQHGGEEKFTDNFQFQFSCRRFDNHKFSQPLQKNEQFGQSVTAVFHIRILPINDHAPRLQTYPLVVKNQSTVRLTSKWIELHDQDDHNNPESASIYLFSWKEIKSYQRYDICYPLIGQFVHSSTDYNLTSFTYTDLSRGLVAFKHLGNPLGELSLSVTDGHFTTTQSVMINSSTPMFRILQPDLIQTDGNQTALIYFEILTNFAPNPRDIKIRISKQGCYGYIVTDADSEPTWNFSYDDILHYRLFYRKTTWNSKYLDTYSMSDRLTKECLSNELNALSINKYVSSYAQQSDLLHLVISYDHGTSVWRNDQIVRIMFRNYDNDIIDHLEMDLIESTNLYIERGRSLIITCEINNRNFSSIDSQILYEVVKAPIYGILILATVHFKVNPVNQFTRADLLSSRIIYEQISEKLNILDRKKQSGLITRDCFQFRTKRNPVIWKFQSESRSIHTVCVDILTPGLDIEACDLALASHQMRSLTDSGLLPTSSRLRTAEVSTDIPVRYDEPVGYSNTINRNQFSRTESVASLLKDRWKMDTSDLHDQSRLRMIYLIEKLPKFGHIISKKLNRSIVVFSNQDLASDDIYYKHVGQNSSIEDSIQLSVHDTKLKRSTVQPISIQFSIFDDNLSPYLIQGTPMLVIIGSYTIISPKYLQASMRSSTDAGSIVYEILYTHQGHVSFLDNRMISISAFTQADLNRGAVIFSHSGAYDKGYCGFDFLVSHNSYRSKIHRFDFIPGIVRLNVQENQAVYTLPFGFETVSASMLKTSYTFHPQISTHLKTESISSLDIIVDYEIIVGTRFGYLVKISSPMDKSSNSFSISNSNPTIYEPITKFTQVNVDEGKILYKMFENLTSSMNTQSNLFKIYLVDSALINISLKRPKLSNLDSEEIWQSATLNLKFNLSFLNIHEANRNRFLNIRHLIVDQGGLEQITREHINNQPIINLIQLLLINKLLSYNELSEFNQLSLYITSLPRYGKLKSGAELIKENYFLTGLIETNTNFTLSYEHDGSDNIMDYFEFQVCYRTCQYVEPDRRMKFLIQIKRKSTIPHIVKPSTSQGNRLGKFHILSGEYKTITNDSILIENANISPEFLFIRILSKPKFGKLCLTSSNPAAPFFQWDCLSCDNPCQISQADINNGRVGYFAYYSDLKYPLSDQITFSVSRPEFVGQLNEHIISSVLYLQIYPAVLYPTHSRLSMVQGQMRMLLSTDNIQVELRPRNPKLTSMVVIPKHSYFKLVKEPKYGQICLDTVPVKGFTYQLLKSKHLFYEPFNFHSPNDSWILEVDLNRFSQTQLDPIMLLTAHHSSRPDRRRSDFTSTLLVELEVQPLITISTLNVLAGQQVTLNESILNLTNYNQTLANTSKQIDIPVISFPTGTRIRSGRIFIHNRLAVTSNYLDETTSTTINITIDLIESHAIQFQAYQLVDIDNFTEELIPYILYLGLNWQPAKGQLKIRVLPDHFPQLYNHTHLNNQMPLDYYFNLTNSYHSGNSLNNPNNTNTLSVSGGGSGGGGGTAAMIIAGLSISLAFLSVLIVCSTGCCMYRRRNQNKSKSDLPIQLKSDSIQKYLQTEEYEDESKEIMSEKVMNSSQPLPKTHYVFPSREQSKWSTENPTKSTDKTTLTKDLELISLQPISSSSYSNQSDDCKCDFSGTIVYLTPNLPATFHVIPNTNDLATNLSPITSANPLVFTPINSTDLNMTNLTLFNNQPDKFAAESSQLEQVELNPNYSHLFVSFPDKIESRNQIDMNPVLSQSSDNMLKSINHHSRNS